MKVPTTSVVFLCIALLSAASFAASNDYQAGKIIKVAKQESHASSGGTDAPATVQVATYHISIQLGDKVYVCQYKADADSDISWIKGKDVQARVRGKAMYVKRATGKDARGSILSTAPAGKP